MDFKKENKKNSDHDFSTNITVFGIWKFCDPL